MKPASIVTLVVSCALLAGCNTTGSSSSLSSIVPGQPVKLTAAQINAVHAGVREGLKDPDSARFGMIAAVRDDKDVITVCGMANAKNSYGGYAGSKPYHGVLAKAGFFVPIGIGGDEDAVQVTSEMCKRSGIEL